VGLIFSRRFIAPFVVQAFSALDSRKALIKRLIDTLTGVPGVTIVSPDSDLAPDAIVHTVQGLAARIALQSRQLSEAESVRSRLDAEASANAIEGVKATEALFALQAEYEAVKAALTRQLQSQGQPPSPKSDAHDKLEAEYRKLQLDVVALSRQTREVDEMNARLSAENHHPP
jgi:hypothetical protein